jgi:hypothetical protein
MVLGDDARKYVAKASLEAARCRVGTRGIFGTYPFHCCKFVFIKVTVNI